MILSLNFLHHSKKLGSLLLFFFIPKTLQVMKYSSLSCGCTLIYQVFQLQQLLFIILVFDFTKRCGHCKRLAPEYETAATKLKKNDPPVPLIKVSLKVNLHKTFRSTLVADFRYYDYKKPVIGIGSMLLTIS